MHKLTRVEILSYIEQHIGDFHTKRLKSLSKLALREILSRKNPYLFKAKNILTEDELVKSLLDAHLSSQEETIFGDFLEGLAIFICDRVYGGKKSSTVGIDLEFDKDGVRYLVVVKSGPHWGNSRQVEKMRDDFRRAKRILGARNIVKNIVAVNGCCYGKDNQPNKGDYLKLCGQQFWKFISGDKNLYIEIIEPLGYQAQEKNDDFLKAYAQIINRFTSEFLEEFCVKGEINWMKLVRFNSAARR